MFWFFFRQNMSYKGFNALNKSSPAEILSRRLLTSAPCKFSSIRLFLIDSTIEITMPSQREACVAFQPTRTSSGCFVFVCLVKPPSDLHILSNLAQGNDFFPSISSRASQNSASISSVSFQVRLLRQSTSFFHHHILIKALSMSISASIVGLVRL